MKSARELYQESLERADIILNGKGNPNHDPSTGRFTSGGGSSSGGDSSGKDKTSKKSGTKIKPDKQEKYEAIEALDYYTGKISPEDSKNITDALEGKAELTETGKKKLLSAIKQRISKARVGETDVTLPLIRLQDKLEGVTPKQKDAKIDELIRKLSGGN